MKYLLLALSLFVSAQAIHAKKPQADFGAELLKGVKADVKKDDAAFKKPAPSRAPASVPTPVVEEEKTFNKQTNQLGKPSW